MTVRTLLTPLVFATGLLLLTACGGGGGSSQLNMPTTDPTPTDPVVQRPTIDVNSPIYGDYSPARAPYVLDSGSYALGPDVIPYGMIDDMRLIDEASGVTLRADSVRDGVGAAALIGLLQEDITDWGEDTVFRWRDPPVVRFARGTTQEQMEAVWFVVVQINKSLPRDWQLDIDYSIVARLPEDVIDGEILLEFSSSETWPETEIEEGSVILGLAQFYTISATSSEIAGAWARIDPAASGDFDEFYGTIGHEILHALGRAHPLDHSRTDTVMSYAAFETADVLYYLDREALLAVYSRLGFDTTFGSLTADLGPWSDTSEHFLGTIPLGDYFLDFGVALRNGLANSWAYSEAYPAMSIADNTALSGSASWSGRLVGYSHLSQPVGGEADMMIDLTDLDGDLDFTSLEHWSAGQRPGMVGTGTLWGDGDLHYTVQMWSDGISFGNYRPNADDDEGIVDGSLYGAGHEGMGGVLERDDLTAAFGGELQ